MRSKLSWAGLLLILLVVNLMIVSKETTLESGRTVLLELAPVDPRSLMQGDYMVLSYALANQVDPAAPDTGTLFLTLDDNRVATVASKESSDGSVALQYRRHHGQVLFGAESYFFQEGQGHVFEGAKYGELKVDAAGRPVLVRLLDSDRQPIAPEH